MTTNAIDKFKPSRGEVKRRLMNAFWMRAHAFILVVWCGGCGFGVSKLLYSLGLEHMGVRYGIAVVVTYAAFLLAVRLWLSYIGFGKYFRAHQPSSRHMDGADMAEVAVDVANLSLRGGMRASNPVVSGQGGTFDGGGASGNWEDGIDHANLVDSGLSSGSGASSGIDLDIGGDEAAIPILLILFAVIAVFSVLIGGIYFGTELLVELAFEILLAVYIRKSIKKSGLPWITAAFKSSWIALVIVFVVAVASGTWLQKTYGTHSATETLHAVSQQWKKPGHH